MTDGSFLENMIKRPKASFNNCYARFFNPGIFFVGICLAATGCHNKTEDINALTGKSAYHEDKAEGVTIYYSKNARMKAILYAKEFIRNGQANPPYTDLKKGLKVDFYNDSQAVESTLTGKYARFYEQDGNILIRDSIVFSKKGVQLNTEELVWSQQIHKVFTEKAVRITTGTEVMYGDGLEANEDFSWYQIKNLKGIIQVEKSELPQ